MQICWWLWQACLVITWKKNFLPWTTSKTRYLSFQTLRNGLKLVLSQIIDVYEFIAEKTKNIPRIEDISDIMLAWFEEIKNSEFSPNKYLVFGCPIRNQDLSRNVQWCSIENHQSPVYDMKWGHFDRANSTFKMLLSSWNFNTFYKKIRSLNAKNLSSIG